MNRRQRKKIVDTYFMDSDEDLLVPPSEARYEMRQALVYESKAFRISHPQEYQEHQEAIKKVLEEIEKECAAGEEQN